MSLFSRWFKKNKKKATSTDEKPVTTPLKQVDYLALPTYTLVTDEEEKRRVSLIASALAADSHPNSQFVVKHIYQVNPAISTISIIAASLAAEQYPESKWKIKAIYEKVSEEKSC
ncbi:hypothetical protein [Enterococcus columbae]|uniref:Uncharacterized protein n=1 Tax=Enterococcus columbae DSM 7374 = ATCC 51263 TaxID=1121865 RepID=S0KMG6_9ENTE|nr:hypothetical protein [Enterococcus columbae]EOT40361.1 hypothetical protein OMW_01615 [Enterococcus columbae DSM 7374 = ATCC 51263]EOW84099.1 hypothetical protein I568_01258 [Enterococcus columbae DSM 7374 = ATCC 51263]OJG25373.1 hypothetical protein RR47_GL001818 [Enterococcus columbae DSM 7374 = ATCC 51263]